MKNTTYVSLAWVLVRSEPKTVSIGETLGMLNYVQLVKKNATVSQPLILDNIFHFKWYNLLICNSIEVHTVDY